MFGSAAQGLPLQYWHTLDHKSCVNDLCTYLSSLITLLVALAAISPKIQAHLVSNVDPLE